MNEEDKKTQNDTQYDPVVVYFDETGDHSLEKIDIDFPLFILTSIITRQSTYINEIITNINKLKFKYFGHEGVILHSREIRKAKPPFDFLLNESKRIEFYEDLNGFIKQSKFYLIVSVIKKSQLKHRYAHPYNPYELALKFNIERISQILARQQQKRIRLIAESRGKNEDDSLRLALYQLLQDGTEKVSRKELSKSEYILTFLPKANNIIGTQLADLCGYPIGRYILAPDKKNIPFEILKDKLLGKINGLECFKIFP